MSSTSPSTCSFFQAKTVIFPPQGGIIKRLLLMIVTVLTSAVPLRAQVTVAGSLAVQTLPNGNCVQSGSGGLLQNATPNATAPFPCVGTSFPAEAYGASVSGTPANNLTFIQNALNAATGGEATLLTPGTFQI